MRPFFVEIGSQKLFRFKYGCLIEVIVSALLRDIQNVT